MKRLFLLTLFLFSFRTSIFAGDLSNYSIPLDSNWKPYSAIVGQDNTGNWQILNLKEISPNIWGFNLGTLSTTIIGGNIGTITTIKQPVWEAQPLYLSNITLNIILPFGDSYTYAQTWTTTSMFAIVGYQYYLEYITIVRTEDKNIDCLGLEFHSRQTDYLMLASEISPTSLQTIIKPPIPIPINAGIENGYRLIVTNKGLTTQKLKIGLIFSYRKE